jgi:YidC/Oxa1 family membrane protein insertase
MISAMLLAIAVFYGWLLVSRVIWPEQPAKPATTRPAEISGRPTTQPATGAASAAAGPEAVPGSRPSGLAVVSGGENTAPIVLGNAAKDSPFPMEMKIDPAGASVSTVQLRGHYETVDEKEPYRIIMPVDLVDESGRKRVVQSFVTRIQIMNPSIEVPLDEAVWKIESNDGQQVVLSADVRTPEGQRLLRVFKTYTLRSQKAELRTSDADLSLKVENVSGQPLEIIITQQGPIGLKKEELRGEDRKVIGAVWREGAVASKLHQRSQVIKHKQITLGSDSKEGTRIAWVSEGNKYFGCIMAPAGRNSGDAPTVFSRAETVVFAPQVTDEKGMPRQDLTFRYITEPVKLAAGGSSSLTFDLYIGPKSKRIFESVETYARRSYYQVLSGEYAWCTPGWLVGVMMFLLNAVHAVWPHNYGIAIILLVLLVKTLLHPLSVKTQISMQKVQKEQARLKPKMDAIKEKYANDRAKMNQAIGELMKEEGINPAGQLLNCLPMTIQIPIWVALWTALGYTVEMRHAPFDGWWIKDLTRPDELLRLFNHPVEIPFLSSFLGMGSVQYLNVLPILLGIFQVLQTKFMPRGNVGPQAGPPGAPDQLEQQRKMMMIMSVVFVLILYNAPSGLTLYIMVNNLLSVIEQWKVRKHLRELEARGQDAESEAGLLKRMTQWVIQHGRTSWLGHKWGELQKEIVEAKRIQSQRPRGKSGR